MIGRTEKFASKMNLNEANQLAWLKVCIGNNGYCYPYVAKNEHGDLLTEPPLKIVISFPTLTLVQGIWWSNAYPKTQRNGILRSIKTVEFASPESMGGGSYSTDTLENYMKPSNAEQGPLTPRLFKYPILTDKLTLSGFGYDSNKEKWNFRHTIYFSMELFGCTDYQADRSKLIFHSAFSTYQSYF